ncbi:MAG: hypothetical protein A4E25_00626 [Methanobacterium sp. PtaB.Bin024]|jgi:hypothetical protein|nr:MAG: hypothetical protein A4E25_00626 [Methanobacterium sp. PtaB.Bin024]
MSIKLSESSVICLSNKSISCNLDDEVVILGLDDGLYYGLDSVGAFVWDLIKEPVAVGEILENISNEYEDVPNTFKKDLMIFLDELLEKGLIEVRE